MKCWVFDLDGTLVDSFEHYFSFIEGMMERPLTPDERQYAVSYHPEDVFSKWLSPEKAQVAISQFEHLSLEDARKIQPFRSIQDLLQVLKERRRSIAICTSRDMRSARFIVENTGLGDSIDLLVSGTCVTNKKPDPEGLLKIQKHFCVKPDEMVMVGDHDQDMQAAQAMGARKIRASWHQHWNHETCALGDLQFTCSHEFYAWTMKQTQFLE